MKFVILISFFSAVAYATHNELSSDIVEKVEECFTKSGLDQDAIKELKKTDRYMKRGCIVTCIMQTFGDLNEGKEFKNEFHQKLESAIIKLGKVYTESMRTDVNECFAKAIAEKVNTCEEPGEMFQCIETRMKKYIFD